MLTGWLFELRADRLVIGERAKMGIFRPCVRTIPCSTISHSLKDATGIGVIYATGYLRNNDKNKDSNIVQRIVMANRDAATGNAKTPITVEYLLNVEAEIIVLQSPEIDKSEDLLAHIPSGGFTMGGLRYKGFGDCKISYKREINEDDSTIVDGELNTRLYQDWCRIFNISPRREYYGYLYRPDPEDPYGKIGVYHRSIFEGTLIKGPRILCRKYKGEQK